MAFLGLFGNYNKPGPGVSKDEPKKAAPIRFFEIFGRKFTKLVQANLIFMIPAAVVFLLMGMIFLFVLPLIPNYALNGVTLPGGIPFTTELMSLMYLVPLPLILLSPFNAGLTFITRNFAREEHAFVWSDFWASVKNNFKLFLTNGIIVYFVYVVLSFSMIYYYSNFQNDSGNYFFLIPFCLCLLIAIVFLFAQYYLPVMFITFDLKFTQCYRNAFIFSLAGLGRNLLLTVIFGVALYLFVAVMPIMSLSIMITLVVMVLILFALVSYLVNFAVYPIIERYLINPYQERMEAEKNGGAKEPEKEDEQFDFAIPTEEDDGDDEKYVYVNGRLMKKSELDDK